MHRRALALATIALASAATGCEDLSRFSTTGDEAYCGAIVGGTEFREGLGPHVMMSLTLDASHLDGPGSPGELTTAEPGAKGAAEVKLLDQAKLVLIAPLQQDALSQLTFGAGSDKNAIYAVTPEKDPTDASLHRGALADARRHRGGPAHSAGSAGQSRRFTACSRSLSPARRLRVLE